MLDPSLTPTRLIAPTERPPVIIGEPLRPSRLRSMYVVYRFGRLLLYALWLSLTRQLTRVRYAELVRELFEDVGGLWIKAGQLLSLRIDIFSQELCRELSKLQSRTLGFPGSIARQIIEEDLGAPLDVYFDQFDETPFAAASIGQVHRGRLRQQGTVVAIKVQKPYSVEIFQRDLSLIQSLVRLFTLIHLFPHMNWEQGLQELRQIMQEELDFHFEASSMRRMKRRLRKHKLYVPKVFRAYCTPRVLVMEFIHAVLMADYIRVANTDPKMLAEWVEENNVDPRRVARRLIYSLFRQLFEDNLFHGDMHPGNIVLLRDNRIALIDFGATTFTEREYLQKFRLFVRALATRDYAKGADLCFMLAGSLPIIDLEVVKERLIRVLRNWATRTLVRELPYHEKSIDNAISEIQKVLFEYRCTMDWAWLRIHRAMSTLDASLIYLYRDVNYTRIAQQYFRKADRRALTAVVGTPLVTRSLNGMITGLDIQDRLNEYTMFQGSLIRRHAQVFQGATNKAADLLSTCVGFGALIFFVIVVLFTLVFIDQQRPGTLRTLLGPSIEHYAKRFPRIDPQFALLFAGLDIYLLVAAVRLMKRLRQKDVRPHERVAAV